MNYVCGLLFVGMLVGACRPVLNVELPYEAPRLVVKAFFSPDQPFSARVDRTYPPTGEITFDTTFNIATVIVYENDLPVDTLRYTHNNTYVSVQGRKPRIGAAYRVRLSATGFPEAFSRNEVVPPPPTILRTELEKLNNYVLTLEIGKVSGQKYRYNVTLSGVYESYQVQLLVEDLLRPDGIVDNCGFRRDSQTFFYRDDCDGNSSLRMRFSSSLNGVVRELFNPRKPSDPKRQSEKLRLQIRNVTSGYWDYYRTVPNKDGFEEAFLQSKTRYSNVDGGYGIVAAYNEQLVIIDVSP